MLRVVVGLGANLGDRLATMRSAADLLAALSNGPVRRSTVYATAPVGPPQPEFLNAAVLLLYGRAPAELLRAMLDIERRLGRIRTGRWEARTIDLDVLWIDGLVVATDELTVPHAHLEQRAFALAPMLELVPDARNPRTGERYVMPPGDVRATHETL